MELVESSILLSEKDLYTCERRKLVPRLGKNPLSIPLHSLPVVEMRGKEGPLDEQ